MSERVKLTRAALLKFSLRFASLPLRKFKSPVMMGLVLRHGVTALFDIDVTVIGFVGHGGRGGDSTGDLRERKT